MARRSFGTSRLGAVLFALVALAWLAPQAAIAQTGEAIGRGIVRFEPRGFDERAWGPSLALVREFDAIGDVPAGWDATPDFGRRDDGRFTARLAIEPGTSLYGTGEIAGPLIRNGRISECWNTDAYGYNEDSKSLYQSHPWVLGVRADGSAFGVLADTTWRCEINLADGVLFASEGPRFPVIVIDRASPQDVMEGLAELIGTIDLPPLWAIGYHQCRYSYNPDSRVREIADGFRSRSLPCDVIWMDIDYMDEYRIFTFDPEQFPDPAGLNAYLHDNGFSSIWMIDPAPKREPGYFVYDEGTAGEHWVQRADGSVYEGEVWPGWCTFPDYTRPETREWWAGLYKDFIALGVDGVWNDMNEPAVFNVASKTMPEDNLHRGGGDLPPGPHARYHNVYGILMARATREGILDARPEKRPFVLTRANYIGGQRYAATWTGDNAAEWDDLEASIPMILNLGLSGQPFSGPDIGGFIGNGDAEQFARWMGIGSMLPFSRGHTGKGNRNKEPWEYGPEVEEASRLALERRYRLLPYFYTLFEEASRNGMPVARPLFFADPVDPALRSEDDAFLLGEDILVAGSVTPEADREVCLPRGIWRSVDLVGGSDNRHLPDVMIRGGAIVPLGPVVQHTRDPDALNGKLTLLVCFDEEGVADGTLYEDAGEGFGYREGEFARTTFTARRIGDSVRIEQQRTGGTMDAPSRPVGVRVILDGVVFDAGGFDREGVIEFDLEGVGAAR